MKILAASKIYKKQYFIPLDVFAFLNRELSCYKGILLYAEIA